MAYAAAAPGPPSAPALAPRTEGEKGLAAKYPGDAGIEKDPQVVFTDTFENGKTNGDNSWGDIVYTDRPENVHGGKRAMELKVVCRATRSSRA